MTKNPLKTLAIVVTIAAGITACATFFLTRFAYHEEMGESRGRIAQHTEDRLNLLEAYQLDHAATHQAIERDLHGAVLMATQTQDQLSNLTNQVSALTREVRKSQAQLAEIGKLRIDLATTSNKVETLGQRLNKINESVDELTKGLKKRAKKDEH
jgi:hypothetical protein